MLQIKNISKNFKSNPKPVLRELSLNLEHGEFCVILGSNGCGKSTLLKCISGEYKIDSGQIVLDKQVIHKEKMTNRAKYISLVNQDITTGTANDLTMLENITLSTGRGKPGSFTKYSQNKNEIINQISKLNLGLEKFIDKNMSELSGGQRQSIATLMAMQPIPKLLLLDEHTSALDPKSKESLLAFTDKMIKQHNITTLMITHNIDDAIKYGSRLIIMQHGQLILDAKTSDKNKLSATEILEILHNNDDFAEIPKDQNEQII